MARVTVESMDDNSHVVLALFEIKCALPFQFIGESIIAVSFSSRLSIKRCCLMRHQNWAQGRRYFRKK